jgi:hypothetical protein
MQVGGCEKSHTIFIGSMGVEYNQLGEVCESIKQAKGEEICMGCYNSFRHLVLGHEQQAKSINERSELEKPWSGNFGAFWSILGAFWS